MIALSTCWNNHRHDDGRNMVREISEMGFGSVEISGGLKPTLLPGVEEAVSSGEIKVSGIHHSCRSSVDAGAESPDSPDCCEFTSDLATERERAIALTLKTVEDASKLSGHYVVVPLGSVPMRSVTDKLESLATDGQLLSKQYVRMKVEAVQTREKLAPVYLERACEALQTIVRRAEQLGVMVGIKCRSHYEQVPTEREIGEIFDRIDSPMLGYWHDFGHAERKANLGFLDHIQWLQQIGPRIIGCHVHDVVWPARDHMIPSEGSVDFADLLPLIPQNIPLVWELSLRRKKKNIIAALKDWLDRFPSRLAS